MQVFTQQDGTTGMIGFEFRMPKKWNGLRIFQMRLISTKTKDGIK